MSKKWIKTNFLSGGACHDLISKAIYLRVFDEKTVFFDISCYPYHLLGCTSSVTIDKSLEKYIKLVKINKTVKM